MYKVGVVLSVEGCGGKGAGLKACKVDVGNDQVLTVVTSASNVREGSRVAVAPAGSAVVGDDGEEIAVKKTSVGGVSSEGMLCDSKMLGWLGGAAGIAAQIPESCEIGSPPPESKPRPGGAAADAPQGEQEQVQGLFEKKLTKEEKKKLAEERRKARKAAKEAKKDTGE